MPQNNNNSDRRKNLKNFQGRSDSFEINEIELAHLTLKVFSRKTVLDSISLNIPVDQTWLVESPSHPEYAAIFLKMMSGCLAPESGQLLWNGSNFFNSEIGDSSYSEVNCNDFIAYSFENQQFAKEQSVKSFIQSWNPIEYPLVEEFDLQPLLSDELNMQWGEISFEKQKCLLLIAALSKKTQILILEDPAVGLLDQTWMQIQDLLQYQQRCGFHRHIFLTNNQRGALNRLPHSKLIIDEGQIYFENLDNYKVEPKKASQF